MTFFNNAIHLHNVEIDLEVSSHEKLQEIVTATAEEVAKDSGVVDLSEDVTMVDLVANPSSYSYSFFLIIRLLNQWYLCVFNSYF